uniref:Uncharacterized protein n=1 Tax=Octopus bimaculoides TaxID=37653 RepID=A0A0L8HB77_OCTBM
MLLIRTAPKENLNTFSAEMVYGVPLTVSGEFLPNTNSDPDVKRYFAQLRDSVGQLRPVPMLTHGTPRSSVPNDLLTANFEFVRRDTRRRPLQSPYDGPYQVIHPGDKTFQLLIGGRQDTVSIDRFPVQVAQPLNRGRPRQITPTLDKEQSPKNRVTTSRRTKHRGDKQGQTKRLMSITSTSVHNWYLFNRPRKDERQSRLWRNLNTEHNGR